MLKEKRASREKRKIPSTPMIWRKPNADHSNCYACLMPGLLRKRWKDRKLIAYPECPSTNSTRPSWTRVERQRSPQPGPSHARDLKDSVPVHVQSSSSQTAESSGDIYEPSHPRDRVKDVKETIKMTQADFNDHCGI